MSRKLTKKQSAFVKEYLIDLNATQAAIRAGYSEKTARQMGSENLAKPYIAEKIQEAMNKRSERLELNADDVLRGILKVRDNAMQTMDLTIVKPTADGGQKEVKVADDMLDRMSALKASELLGKHLKLFTEKVEHSGEVATTINIIPASKRKKK